MVGFGTPLTRSLLGRGLTVPCLAAGFVIWQQTGPSIGSLHSPGAELPGPRSLDETRAPRFSDFAPLPFPVRKSVWIVRFVVRKIVEKFHDFSVQG